MLAAALSAKLLARGEHEKRSATALLDVILLSRTSAQITSFGPLDRRSGGPTQRGDARYGTGNKSNQQKRE